MLPHQAAARWGWRAHKGANCEQRVTCSIKMGHILQVTLRHWRRGRRRARGGAFESYASQRAAASLWLRAERPQVAGHNTLCLVQTVRGAHKLTSCRVQCAPNFALKCRVRAADCVQCALCSLGCTTTRALHQWAKLGASFLHSRCCSKKLH